MNFYDLQTIECGTYVVIHSERGISKLYFSKIIPKFPHKKINIYKSRLDLKGTLFQKKVWSALLKIPKGKTKTYTEVARMIGKPTAVRAVASAIAKNEIGLLIPCHRVVPTAGGVGNYRWGSERKRKLIDSEK